LSITEQRAVGFIPAWSLAFLHISRIQCYVGQVEGQRKEQPAPATIEGEKEWEVERILNKW